jgi:hypothetical protein
VVGRSFLAGVPLTVRKTSDEQRPDPSSLASFVLEPADALARRGLRLTARPDYPKGVVRPDPSTMLRVSGRCLGGQEEVRPAAFATTLLRRLGRLLGRTGRSAPGGARTPDLRLRRGTERETASNGLRQDLRLEPVFIGDCATLASWGRARRSMSSHLACTPKSPPVRHPSRGTRCEDQPHAGVRSISCGGKRRCVRHVATGPRVAHAIERHA